MKSEEVTENCGVKLYIEDRVNYTFDSWRLGKLLAIFLGFSFMILPIFSQSYTYVELSAKNQKQIANARKNIEKSYQQEENILKEARNNTDAKLVSLYRARIAEYRTIYEIYSSHSYEFWSKFKGDPDEVLVALDYSSQARDIYIAALNELNEVDRVDDMAAKLQIIKHACDKFKQATELMEKAYDIYRSTPLESDAQTKMRNRQYNDSLQNVLQTNTTIISSSNDSLPQALATSGDTLNLSQIDSRNKNAQPEETVILDKQAHHEDTRVINSSSYESLKTTNDNSPYHSVNNKIFWVQIAACRVPLQNWQLPILIPDTLKMVEKFIDHWYKYRIGPFNQIQAHEYLLKCGVKGAFVVAER